MRDAHPILVFPREFIKKFLPLNNFFKTLCSSLKKGVEGGRKLMCFHLKICVILFNSFCVFLLGHIDIVLMFLLLPVTKNKTIIQNKTEGRQSATSSSCQNQERKK